ncbi:MAG: hypothetical protein IPJ65_06685 [Archangiaceae bacterium]|nr:hypothetical protein [Archangiaceae bacterium]
MPSREDAREIALHLRSLAGGEDVTRLAAARLLARLSPMDATELLHEVIALARDGFEPARASLSAFTRALEREAAQMPYAAQLKRVAALSDQREVETLFVDDRQPAQQYNVDAAKRADARLFTQSLGHMKTQARLTRNPDQLARLAVASNPEVVRNVLINPRVTEALVVRIAARRPARPEPLVEIWHSARWASRPAVRRALAFNPYLPPDVGTKIVPLLSLADLRELSRDNSVHPALRDQAKALLDVAKDP